MKTTTEKPETLVDDAIERYRTEWTAKGHRLEIARWKGSVSLTVQSEVMNLVDQQKWPFILAQLTVLTHQTRSESTRFVLHALTYFQDGELAGQAEQVLVKLYAGLQDVAAADRRLDPNAN